VKTKFLGYREIALQVFVMLLVAYMFVLIYKLKNPYTLPGIERRFTLTLTMVGTVVVILYLPYEKIGRVVKKITGISFTVDAEKLLKPMLSLSVGQKFVLVAVVLLVFAAFVLATGSEADANRTAILAYYFLVFGVLNLLVEYVMNPEEESRFDPHPELRAAVSLILLSVVVHFTPEITERYPHADLVIFIPSLLILLYLTGKYRKAREKRSGE